MRHPAQYTGQDFRKLWHKWTDPAPEVQRLEERRQAQFLAAFYLVLLPIAFLLTIVPGLQRHAPAGSNNPYLYFAVATLLLLVLGYTFSRTPHFRASAALLIIVCTVINILSTLVEADPQLVITAMLALFPVLLSNFLLAQRFTVLLSLAQAALLYLLDGVMPGHIAVTPFYLVLALLIILLGHYRDLLEHDRRTELDAEQRKLEAAYGDLENRVAARTAELADLNEHLQQEIDERERAEESLIEERNLLRTLIEIMPDAIFVLGSHGRYLMDNAEHRRLLGAQMIEEVVGKGANDFFPPEEAAKFDAEEQRIMASGDALFNLETCFTTPDGQQRWGQVSKIPFRDSSGKVMGLVGVVRDITELKQAETLLRQAYRASEKRLSEQSAELSFVYNRLWYQANLLENVSESIVAVDLNGVIQSWNRAAERMYGYPAQEVIGQSVWDYLTAILPEVQRVSLLSTLQERRPWQGELAFTRQDGRLVVYVVSVSHIYDYEQQAIGVVSVSRDMTAQKHIEAAEGEQRQLAEALRDTAAAINATLELDEVLDRIFLHVTRIVPCDAANISLIKNDAAQVVRYWGRMSEVEKAAMQSSNFNIHTTPTLRTMIETDAPLFITDTNVYPGWVRKGDSNLRSYIGVPIKIQGKVVGFINATATEPNRFTEAHVDGVTAFSEQVATALRNAQMYETIRHHAAELVQHVADRTAELERQRTQLQIILDSMTEGVVSSVVTDAGLLQPIYVNEALKRLLGYDLADWREGLVLTDIMVDSSGEQYGRIFEAIMRKGRWQGEARLRRKDGLEFQAQVCSTRVLNSEGLFVGVVTVIRDISQEKALEEQRSRFVANASHELRTPLTNLMTRLWLLQKQPERLPDHLAVLEVVANRMRDLVEDLLDVSRLERGVIPLECAPMNICQTVTEVIAVQQAEADAKGVQLYSHLPDSPLLIWGDGRRVHQVVTNLVMNAINYTPTGGQIQLDTAIETDSDNDVKHVMIRIRDTGIGIPPQHLTHLFQPFYRVGEQGKGTGLGLAIAREIVTLHGGDIVVTSEVGVGSQFSIRLPLWNGQPSSIP